MDKPRLAAMMPVRNEANRYLCEVLRDLSEYVDSIVILDDASTDATPDLCRSFEKTVVHRSETPRFFGRESELRAELWRHTTSLEPDWILAIDADERFEARMKHEIAALMAQDEFDVVEFRLFDFWDGYTHVRVDGAWDPWMKQVRALFRFDPAKHYTWPERTFHCPRAPLEVMESARAFQSDLRIKHFGWSSEVDIARKYEQYKAIDDSEHLRSVKAGPDEIRLEPWIEGKVLPF